MTARLTPRQLECLRLVLTRRGSKEIARELGISSYTVDEHIKAATRALGVTSRFEAARILAEHEGPPQSLGTSSLGVPELTETVTYGPTPQLGVTLETPGNGLSVQEDRATFEAPLPGSGRSGPRLRLLTWGIERNDLTTFQRLAYVLILMMAIALATGVMAVAFVGLTALLRALLRGVSTTIMI